MTQLNYKHAWNRHPVRIDMTFCGQTAQVFAGHIGGGGCITWSYEELNSLVF